MRALCSLGGPLPAGARLLALRVPGNTQPLHFLVESKSRVRDVRAQVYSHFREQGHTDLEIFGLALFHNNEYLFLDTESKLSKYAPKSWRASHTHGLGANGRPLLELHLAVQFYVESPILLGENLCKHLYYLQLRSNLILRDILPMEIVLLLAGLALQADYGNARDYEGKDYFNPKEFAPQSLSGDWVSSAIRACHKDYHGMSKSDAETRFIREACILSDPINSHLYRMKASKTDAEPGSVCISVSARGVEINNGNGKTSNFVWSSIVKLCFDRKRFEIKTEDDKVTLYASDDEKCKFLLSLCKDTHQFSMKVAPVISEISKKEDQERKQCFGYNKQLTDTHVKNNNDQRVSLISSTSSNTTSGIVSDRVHSEDELEIMIDTPPAPSLESLAFAHLLEDIAIKKINKIKQIHEPKHSEPKARKSLTHDSFGATPHLVSLENVPELDSNKVVCSGSQCSSSCSTVVLTRAGFNKNRRFSNGSSLELSLCHTAQNSVLSNTSTFVNLGICRNDDASSAVYDGFGQPVTVAASSETSGVYTMKSSDTAHHSKTTTSVSDICTAEDESYHYDEYNLHPINNNSSTCSADNVRLNETFPHSYTAHSSDCIDGIGNYLYGANQDSLRIRPNSSLSIRSFHGDGSDPTDHKHNILSALELSDLIVGRGDYPIRQSVSDTLDSVSDYVRLPLPMNGDSYLKGHEDTAPSDDSYLDIIGSFNNRPPTPPKRIDSQKSYSSTPNLLDLSDAFNFTSIPIKPPPPYEFNHVTIPVQEILTDLPLTQSSVSKQHEMDHYDTEEASARVITSKPMINILKAEIGQVGKSSERIFAGPVSAAAPLPPPRSVHHRPPPPPPRAPHLHQLYSDVDFVNFPLQDPSVSRQNYLDSKIAASLNSTLRLDANYSSSPYLQSSALSDRSFGSTQTLSDAYVRLAGGSPSIYISTPDFTKRLTKTSASKLNEDTVPPLPIPRTKSVDNILSSCLTAQNERMRRMQPPPPPPYEYKRNLPSHLNTLQKNELPPRVRQPHLGGKPTQYCKSIESKTNSIDIKSIRERSKNLDLPLISALCNDRSLLKQTKVLVNRSTQQQVSVAATEVNTSKPQRNLSHEIFQDPHLTDQNGLITQPDQNPAQLVTKSSNVTKLIPPPINLPIKEVLLNKQNLQHLSSPSADGNQRSPNRLHREDNDSKHDHQESNTPLKETKKTKRHVKVAIKETKTPEEKIRNVTHCKFNSLGKKFIMRNPNDKLPEIPGEVLHTPRAKSNTYVSHPAAKPRKVQLNS